MPTHQRRTQPPATATSPYAGYRPAAHGSNASRPGAAVADAGALDVFGQAVAGEAAMPPAWAAVVSGRTVLRSGSRGEGVEHLQRLLLANGATIIVDGVFAADTRRALVAFQRGAGIAADGVAGRGTAAALAAARSGPAGGAVRTPAPSGRQPGGGPEESRTIAGVDIEHGAFEQSGLRAGVFAKALDAFSTAFAEGRSDSMIVTIIDYELPSSEKRFWVIDLERGRLLFHQHTSHGSGSDRNHDGRMDAAGNRDGSGMSNVGLLKTAETYTGKHGKSLRLDGLERGFNDNARSRAVVVHAASYVDDAFIERNGKAGRSLGCPALDPDVNGRIIDTIKGGKLLFAYYPDPRWLAQSRYLGG
ncbi:MAG: murein L,D-transpeptidase catalytic domain family protein [Myxococcota bacterium]|nr:murein L,D-transpeptidase catalytic domain family protein [Myxococcota bacterium]MEC8423651.1 murein L,D-transpeptidase catalytic domain family protein [Myxococcota bacterium]